MDEDLIPVFKCVTCKGNVCKDGYGKRIEGFKVICLECYGINNIVDTPVENKKHSLPFKAENKE